MGMKREFSPAARPLALAPLLVGLVTALLLGALGAPKADAASGVIDRGPDEHRTVALTFDDGYAAQRCLEIADILTSYGVPATWFPNGVYVVNAPEVWRSIGKRFPIANHTMHHPSLVGMSARQIRKELLTNQRKIEGVTGVPMTRILRPTFGAYDERVLRVAEQLGYRVVNWDVSAADTSPRATDRGIAARALSGRPGSIILMHCGPAVTPRILPIVIARYACDGYRFATLEGLLAGKRGTEAKVECPPPRLPGYGKKAKPPRLTGGRAEVAAPKRKDPVDPLARFLEQTPEWTSCDGLECATIRVPPDHDAPASGKEAVRLYRIRASGEREGTLVIGPDGLGRPASELMGRVATAASERLLAHYDLVAFDPRRAKRSEAAAYADLARDLDIVRRVLEADVIDYYGTAFGATVGALYATLFPEHVGAMVLDAPMDERLPLALQEMGPAAGDDTPAPVRPATMVIGSAEPGTDSNPWTLALADRLGSRVAVGFDGTTADGPAYLVDGCAAAAIEAFLIDGVEPETDLGCGLPPGGTAATARMP